MHNKEKVTEVQQLKCYFEKTRGENCDMKFELIRVEPSFCIRVLSWPLPDNESLASRVSLISSFVSHSIQSGGECHLTKSSNIHPGFAA